MLGITSPWPGVASALLPWASPDIWRSRMRCPAFEKWASNTKGPGPASASRCWASSQCWRSQNSCRAGNIWVAHHGWPGVRSHQVSGFQFFQGDRNRVGPARGRALRAHRQAGGAPGGLGQRPMGHRYSNGPALRPQKRHGCHWCDGGRNRCARHSIYGHQPIYGRALRSQHDTGHHSNPGDRISFSVHSTNVRYSAASRCGFAARPGFFGGLGLGCGTAICRG